MEELVGKGREICINSKDSDIFHTKRVPITMEIIKFFRHISVYIENGRSKTTKRYIVEAKHFPPCNRITKELVGKGRKYWKICIDVIELISRSLSCSQDY